MRRIFKNMVLMIGIMVCLCTGNECLAESANEENFSSEFDNFGIRKGVSVEELNSVEDDKWIKYLDNSNVGLTKEWTIGFNKNFSFKDIDGILIENSKGPVAVGISLKGLEKKAVIVPLSEYLPNEIYTLKIYLNNGKKYKMNFNTTSNENNLVLDGDALIENRTIEGDLIIDGGGEVTLRNVKVKGRIIVNDVAQNSLYLEDVSAQAMELNDTDGARIVTSELKAREDSEGLTQIGKIAINAESENPIQLKGDFAQSVIEINKSSDIAIDYETSISEIVISEEASNVNITSEADVAASIGNLTGSVPQELNMIKEQVDVNKEKISDIITNLNQVPAEAVEDIDIYMDRGRTVKAILEEMFAGNLGLDYINYSEYAKIRTANTLRSFMQNSEFTTVNQVEKAFEEAKLWNRVFGEGMKYKAYSNNAELNPEHVFPTVSNTTAVGTDITSLVWSLSDGISESNLNNDIIIEIAGAFDEMTFEYPEGITNNSAYIMVEEDKHSIKLIGKNNTSEDKIVQLQTSITDTVEENVSNTSFYVIIEGN